MKKSFDRIFNAGWNNFKRNSYLSFGTTGVMVLVLLLFSALVGVNYLSNRIVTILQEKVDITAYFKNDSSQDDIFKVRDQLKGLAEVKNVEYVSRDQALQDFKTAHAGDALIQESLAELQDNPLEASLNIKSDNSANYASIVSFLEASKLRTLIDKINFYENEQVIHRVESIANGVQNWGFLVTIALAVVAMLVTFNTIRLTIYNEKQEIEIMKLVGGSNWHIKAPFLIEGGLYGIFASVLALIIFYPSVYFVSPKVELLMPGANIGHYFLSNSYQFVPLVFFVGMALGVVSSFIAIRRFLKV